MGTFYKIAIYTSLFISLLSCVESETKANDELYFNKALQLISNFSSICKLSNHKEKINHLKVKALKTKDLSADEIPTDMLQIFNNFLFEAQDLLLTNNQYQNCEEIEDIVLKYDRLFHIYDNTMEFQNTSDIGYSQLELNEVKKVTKMYGSVILLKEDFSSSAELAQRPWSSYWYPFAKSEYIVGKYSALKKFDNLALNSGFQANAVEFEKETVLGAQMDGWEGHCHAWAMASTFYDEPTETVTIGDVSFSPSDLKFLLIKLVEGSKYEKFGIKYLGNFKTDGTYQDLRPEAFHKLLSHFLSRQKAILMDDDPGVEVWTKPIFSYRTEISEDQSKDGVLNVETWVGVVRQQEYYPSMDTNEDDYTWIRYNYRLYFIKEGLKFKIIAGEWTSPSNESHPDIVIVPNKNQTLSFNPSLQDHREFIEEIADRGTN